MERIPGENNRRVVNANPSEQETLRKVLREIADSPEVLSDHDIDKFEGFDEMFSYLQGKLIIFLGEYGLKQGTHFTPESIVLSENHPHSRILEASAQWLSELQKIEVYRDWESGNRLGFVAVLVHEMIHAQAFQSWKKISEEERTDTTIVTSDDGEIGPYCYYKGRRQGLNVYDKEEKAYLHDLDEAVTEELAMRFMATYRNDFPFLREEVALREEVIKKNFSSDPVVNFEVRSVDWSRTKAGILDLERASYKEERDKLWNMVDLLYTQNKNTFSSSEAVFKMIATGAMTGNILPFARLYEATFGKGSFRALAEKTV